MTVLTSHACGTHKVYGLTCEQYDEILRRQGGVCGVGHCLRPGELTNG
jgi:hypothetical protein